MKKYLKYFFIAELTLLAKHFRAYGEGRSKENVFTAIDQSAVKIEKQLKKFREKVKDHHKQGIPATPSQKLLKKAGVPVGLAAMEDSFPRIVKTQAFAAKPMSPEHNCITRYGIASFFRMFSASASIFSCSS